MVMHAGSMIIHWRYSMRAREFVREDLGATTAGAIATVSQPLGAVQSRWGFAKPAKYANSLRADKPRKRYVS